MRNCAFGVVLAAFWSCAPKAPTIEVEVCPQDAGSLLEWSSPGAEAVVLMDGDDVSVVERVGTRFVYADRTKIVRLAAMGEGGTTWQTSRVEACRAESDGGVGRVLLSDGTPAAGDSVFIDGSSVIANDAGEFVTPVGSSVYSIGYSYQFAPSYFQRMLYLGVSTRSPVVHGGAGDALRSASLQIVVSESVPDSGKGILTVLNTQAGDSATGDSMAAPTGVRTNSSFSWRGGTSTPAIVTAVRLLERSTLTGNRHDLAEILGVSAATPTVLRDQETSLVTLKVNPTRAATRELLIPTELGNTESMIDYGPPTAGGGLYSGRVWWNSKIPIIEEPGYAGSWAVRYPVPRGDTTPGVQLKMCRVIVAA